MKVGEKLPVFLPVVQKKEKKTRKLIKLRQIMAGINYIELPKFPGFVSTYIGEITLSYKEALSIFGSKKFQFKIDKEGKVECGYTTAENVEMYHYPIKEGFRKPIDIDLFAKNDEFETSEYEFDSIVSNVFRRNKIKAFEMPVNVKINGFIEERIIIVKIRHNNLI